jgi:diguanylate cyclase (GGDEF)-like protein
MKKPLRVIIIEDSEDDAILVVRALQAFGYEVSFERVDTSEGLQDAFRHGPWDLVISDYSLPRFSIPEALKLLEKSGLELPFIIVSGKIGEETAVKMMKLGAHDYLLKDNLSRLNLSIEHELREAKTRKDHKCHEDIIHHMAYYDVLTGLPNRALLQDRLHQAILTGTREKKPLTFLLMDLNGFKAINDTLGHHNGDLVLKQIGGRLQSVVRESDTVARLGGDEFALLLPGVGDPEYARLVVRKIFNALKPPFMIDGKPLKIETSIGVAFWPDNAGEMNLLMQRADAAMYAAKEAGVDYFFYTRNLEKYPVPRLKLIEELRYAIEHNEFRLYYQPKFSFKTGKITGVEGLVRWQHAYRGLILPDQFIPLAEQTGLMNRLTQWILNEMLRQSHVWNRQGIKVPLSLNLSVCNLQNEEIIESIPLLLSKWNVAPNLLCLELTENVIISDVVRNSEILSKLRQLGISVSIDDFGTGYSSLSYLKKLPVDEIKIDILLIKEIVANKEDSIIVHSIIDLCHDLDLRVVAEGVENENTWVLLNNFGCDSAQGYYLSRPVPASELDQQWA